MSNGKVTRITLDLGAADFAAVDELVRQMDATTKADAIRRAVRRCVAIGQLGADPPPEAVKVALSL